MTNQMLLGESAEVLEERDKWLMIRLHHDGYQAWVDRKQAMIAPVSNKTVVAKSLLSTAVEPSGRVMRIPAGSMLRELNGRRFTIGDAFYMLEKDAQAEDTLEAYALMFLGTPYLWGGRTLMGIDCSGFSQVVMRLCDIHIQRDAHQQAEEGQVISFIEESRTGDLAFFDNAEGRITHVGIVLGDTGVSRQIIHASGMVRQDVLDHQGIFNQDTNTYSHNLRIIKRFR
jgi:gamma-D-glutamyl-L-lysine dipeptidyl-peptidase